MNKLTEEELKPCPFCGSESIDPNGWMSEEKTGPACDDCGATAETVEIWNTRAVIKGEGCSSY